MTRSVRRDRIWMLTSVHPPLDARIFHREARAAAEAGYRVTILAPDAEEAIVDGVTLRRLPGPPGRLGRVVRWPILLWLAAVGRADLYQIHDPELLPWGLILHLITGRPVIYDAHEYFSESIRSKTWIPARLRRPIAWLAERLEKFIASRLSAVIAVTPEMTSRFERVQKRSVTVMNFPPIPSLPVPPPERLPVAIYAGLMNRERGLDILRDTAANVRRRHPGFELRVLGRVEFDGLPDEQALPPEAWAESGVQFLGAVPQPEVAAQLAAASIGWLPMNPTIPSKRLAWPVKLGEYMAAGLPIVASDLPVQAAVIREADCGIVVGSFTAASNAAAIIELLDDPAVAREMGERGRHHALAHLTWESQAAILVGLYEALLGPRTGS